MKKLFITIIVLLCSILAVFADSTKKSSTNNTNSINNLTDNVLTNTQITNVKSQDPDDNTNQRYQTNDLDELLQRTVKTNYDWSIIDRDKSEFDTNSITVKLTIKEKIKFKETLTNKPSPLVVKVPDFKKRKPVIDPEKNRLKQEMLRKQKIRIEKENQKKKKLLLKRKQLRLKRYRLFLKRKKLYQRRNRKKQLYKKKRKRRNYYSIIKRKFKRIKSYYYSNPYYPKRALRKFLRLYNRYSAYFRRNWNMRKSIIFYIARSRFDARQYLRALRLFTWLKNVSRGRAKSNFYYWINVCRRRLR